MADEDSVLKEVDQELAEERQLAMFRRYGPAAIGAAAALVLGVGASQLWNARQNTTAEARALEFKTAVDTLSEDEPAGRQALAAIAEEGGGGYGVLAEFHRAASFARAGEREAAVAAYRRIYEGGATPKRLRDLARLRAAYLSLSDGRDAVLAHLGDLADAGGAFAYNAEEIAGLAALEAKDYETALAIFRRLSVEVGAPEPVRARAEDFAALAASAKAGVNITGQTQLSDVLESVGAGSQGEAETPAGVSNDDADKTDATPPQDAATDGDDETQPATPDDAGETPAEDKENE